MAWFNGSTKKFGRRNKAAAPVTPASPTPAVSPTGATGTPVPSGGRPSAVPKRCGVFIFP